MKMKYDERMVLNAAILSREISRLDLSKACINLNGKLLR